jgi:hypothetical protein
LGNFDSIAYARGNTSLISCAWGNWYGNSIPLTITGLAAGSTTLTIALLDAYDNVLGSDDRQRDGNSSSGEY